MGKGWLDNYNDSKVSVPEGFQGEGYSTKGRDYSPAWGGQFQMGGYVYPVNYVPKAQDGFTSFMSNLGDNIVEFFSDEKEEKIKPIKKTSVKKSGNKDNTRTLNIVDPRKKLATTNQPLRPNSDLVGGKYSSKHLDRLIQEAKRQGMSKQDIMNLSAMGFQETKWGKTDGNIGHVMGDWGGDDDYQLFINAYNAKMKEADRLGITDPAMRLQVYNGLGTITPSTEKDYHGFEMQKIYGVPIPKGEISMKKNPLYGKQVLDIRDNVLAKNPEYIKYMDSIYKTPVPNAKYNIVPGPKMHQKSKIEKEKLTPLKKKEMGGNIPGSVGFTYARTKGIPSEGPYAKKTMPSAQEGKTITLDEGDGKKRKILTDSKEYADLFNQGKIGVKNDDESISMNPLNEVVVTPYDKQYPFYQELSDEEKKYFNSDSPIGRQLRSRAQDNVGFNAEKAKDFAMGWLRDLPLAGMQAPQSAFVEAVEAIRGNDYNFLNVIEPDKQRKPSDVWGIESDYYGVNPLNTMMPPINYKTIANTTMDFVTDPLLIEGIVRQPLQKGIKNIISSDIDRQLLNIETIGKKQGLSAHEIAKNQMDQIGITSNQRKAYTPLVSETLEKYVTPYGYVGPNGKNKITDIIDNIKQGGWKNNLTNQGKLYHPEREDAFRLYLGLPQKNKTFNVSDTAPVLHNSYPKGTFNNMDIYNANTEDIIESVTPNIPKSFKYNDLVTNKYLDILNKNAVVSRDNTLMGGYNKVLTEDGLQYNDIWDLNVPISFKSLVPNKISESPALKNIFYKTNVQGVESPRSIKVPVEKFVGKPFMTHGNLPLTKTQYIEKLKTSAIETKNRYMTEDALEAFGNEYNSKLINASDNFLEKLNKYKQGGVIKDDLGQWAHPGEITEINSNDITMQGVPYPVLGISDTGDTKLMKPGKDYKFKGKKVTEYPLAKDGKELVKLNQLTNFTNYNTKQPGGWLDKY